jgi:hypothetical protein
MRLLAGNDTSLQLDDRFRPAMLLLTLGIVAEVGSRKFHSKKLDKMAFGRER